MPSGRSSSDQPSSSGVLGSSTSNVRSTSPSAAACRQLDVPVRIAVAEVPGGDTLAVRERVDPERLVRRDADAAEREREDVVALADPVERERELGTRALRPDAPLVRMGPPVSEPAVVAQVG